jgi:hypothetical protein
MKNTLNNIFLNDCQIDTVIDLLEEEIKAKRHSLRKSAEIAIRHYVGTLAHLRSVKKTLTAQQWLKEQEEAGIMQAEESENSNLYDFFTIGVREAERRKAVV